MSQPGTSETVTVEGGCHCGAVRFSANVEREPVLLDCNCSICRRTGYLHLIVPHADFTLLSGADALTSYRFGTGAAEHLFCRVCGIKSFYQPRSHPDCWSVHYGCLDNPELLSPEHRLFDGANWEQAAEALD
ncbi:GFA family protein [Alterisphingorhabdus coralli]|uniref:GFA family protein n=1 Tax=Alterisphingorhabdus coralli TaxID=3071408 RepID=A0AA97F6L2_9SPHN|nr:GFA family protein [Parasphingorhabdus sp. SCSIO 66989]WOE74228.1 GFA family protein [Parasphingorhabdus sp. SCSIO 66989]